MPGMAPQELESLCDEGRNLASSILPLGEEPLAPQHAPAHGSRSARPPAASRLRGRDTLRVLHKGCILSAPCARRLLTRGAAAPHKMHRVPAFDAWIGHRCQSCTSFCLESGPAPQSSPHAGSRLET